MKVSLNSGSCADHLNEDNQRYFYARDPSGKWSMRLLVFVTVMLII